MTLPPQKFREMVFQMLYGSDMGRAHGDDLVPLMMEELAVNKRTARLAQERMEAILAKKQTIDDAIGEVLLSYAFERIPSVERNILRVGIFEMLFDDEIPPKVAIAEAMRLARKFSSPEAARFVNAVLDAVYKRHEGLSIETEELKIAAEVLQKSEDANRQASEKKQEPQ